MGHIFEGFQVQWWPTWHTKGTFKIIKTQAKKCIKNTWFFIIKIWPSIESNYSNHVSIYKYGFHGFGWSVFRCTALSILHLHTWGHQQYFFNMVFTVQDWVCTGSTTLSIPNHPNGVTNKTRKYGSSSLGLSAYGSTTLSMFNQRCKYGFSCLGSSAHRATTLSMFNHPIGSSAKFVIWF